MDKKRLVVCCDGTWNDADSAADFTNVARIAWAVKPIDKQGVAQIVYYHSGVGTGGDALDVLVGGAIGLGLSRNVRGAYEFLANNYCAGDEISLFGFSRGAYTARSIAGLIGWAGLLHKRDMDDFALLWEGYRLRAHPDQPDIRPQFPDRHETVPIKCIGVWDTVGALGIPGHLGGLFQKLYQFHDTDLGPHVENAFQALALDEHRGDFVPTVWTRPPNAPAGQTVLQVWFPGAHSDVGGGYDAHGLSDVALAWMAGQVERFIEIDAAYLAAKQDQREAWGLGKIHDSATGLFALRPRINRRVGTSAAAGEMIHASVAVRRAAFSSSAMPYNPPGLPASLPADRVTLLGPFEEALRWAAPNPSQTGRSARSGPRFLDRTLRGFATG